MRTRSSPTAFITLIAVLATACLPLARAPSTASPEPLTSSPTLAPTPTSSPTRAPSPTSSRSPSASASPVSSQAIRVNPVATLPGDPHFFSVGGEDNRRILLFDSSSTRPPVEVVAFDTAPAPSGGPDVRAISFGASADGRVLVVARRYTETRTIHYLVRPQTGEVIVLLTDLAPSFSTPVVSPDGSRYAYARRGDANSTGIFVANARPGPDPKRIVASDPQMAGSPPQPVAWSPDGAWLAVSSVDDGGSRIGVVQIQGGETTMDVATGAFTGGNARLLGPGSEIDWRAGDQNLLITSSRHAFGGRSLVYTTTLAGGPPREVYVPGGDARLAGAQWHPALDRFVVQETQLCCGANMPATFWLRKTDGSGTKVIDGVTIYGPWWSKDGTRLWAQIVGDDSVGGFRDLFTTTVVSFCLRSPAPPCA